MLSNRKMELKCLWKRMVLLLLRYIGIPRKIRRCLWKHNKDFNSDYLNVIPIL
jgi:hypothetical protein